jgi:hypothetical protein
MSKRLAKAMWLDDLNHDVNLTIEEIEGWLRRSATAMNSAICAECGKIHTPKRKQQRGRRSFCADCGLTAAWKHAKRSERERKRATKEAK